MLAGEISVNLAIYALRIIIYIVCQHFVLFSYDGTNQLQLKYMQCVHMENLHVQYMQL